MEAEDYLGGSRLFRRLKKGPHGELVERYARRLVEERLARKSTRQCLNVVGGLLDWIAKRRCMLANIDEHVVERYLRHRANRQSIQTGNRAALKRWLSVLRDEGAIAPSGTAAAADRRPQFPTGCLQLPCGCERAPEQADGRIVVAIRSAAEKGAVNPINLRC